MDNSIIGKVAFITGAAKKRSIGHAVALRLAEEGADVVLFDKIVTPKSVFPGDEGWKGLVEVVKEIEAIGKKALALTGDISDTSEVETAVETAIQEFGKINILINCAGIRGPVGIPVVEGDEFEWRRIFDVNTIGCFIISKVVAKDMIKRNEGGKIVHIASVAGRFGAPGYAAYAASKWAAIGLVQSLALELAPNKINVNAINPGFFPHNLKDEDVKTQVEKKGVFKSEIKSEDYKRLDKSTPLGCMETVVDISNLVTFLVSDQSDYMTGQDINIFGGIKMP